MINLECIADSIFAIKDRIKIVQIHQIKLEDIAVFSKFCEVFNESEFRQSIRVYRNTQGKENLKQELELILRVVNDYSKFYNHNKRSLETIELSRLLRNYLKPFELDKDRAHKRLLPINKTITELSSKYESANWNLSENDPKIKRIYEDLISAKKEHLAFKEVYLQKIRVYDENLRKNNSLLSFKFSSLLEKLSTVSNIIIEDYIDPIELFKRTFNDDLIDKINEVFEPNLNNDSAKDFFNNISTTDQNLKLKKNPDTKFYFLIDSLSEKIKDDELKNKWINSILLYFDKRESVYNKKKRYEKQKDSEFAKKITEALSDTKET